MRRDSVHHDCPGMTGMFGVPTGVKLGVVSGPPDELALRPSSGSGSSSSVIVD
jgi:hypothetical protein